MVTGRCSVFSEFFSFCVFEIELALRRLAPTGASSWCLVMGMRISVGVSLCSGVLCNNGFVFGVQRASAPWSLGK